MVNLKHNIYYRRLLAEWSKYFAEQTNMPLDPIISVALQPSTPADEAKLSEALSRIAEDDLSIRVRMNEGNTHVIIAGMSEQHLESVVHRLFHYFKVEATACNPEIEYRETIKNPAKSDGTFMRYANGRGQYGHVVLKLEPTMRGAEFKFKNELIGDVIPKQYIPAIESGIKEALKTGTLRGYPVVDVNTILLFGSYHKVDSSETAFREAASLAFKQAFEKAKPVLLEPLMKVQVDVPDEFAAAVFDDICNRRGKVEHLQEPPSTLHAIVPLSQLLGYQGYIHDKTVGQGKVIMDFIRYEEVPRSNDDIGPINVSARR